MEVYMPEDINLKRPTTNKRCIKKDLTVEITIKFLFEIFQF
jgi:hypothetical protein